MKGLTPAVINWIFITVAGGVILLFFFNIITTQSAIEEQKAASELLTSLNTLLVSKSVSTDTASEIRVTEQIRFSCISCEPELGCESSIGIKSFESDTAIQPIFAPKQVAAQKMFVFTRSFEVPFKVTNFLYIVQPGQKIAFPSLCNGVCNSVWEKIPQRIKDAKIVVKGEEGKKRILFSNCNTVTNDDVCIDPSTKVVYFADASYPYINEEQILAAVFAEKNMFECNMKKAMYRMNEVVDVLEGKILELRDGTTTFPTLNCDTGYNNFNTTLSKYRIQSLQGFASIPSDLAQDNQFLRINSCGSMY